MPPKKESRLQLLRLKWLWYLWSPEKDDESVVDKNPEDVLEEKRPARVERVSAKKLDQVFTTAQAMSK